ncbi:hypothetical protein [Alkalibacillus haloalkaliphilus]|uniref:hypothetical protein n=1 Tax=Alkalibacillus haloalkaliphilus TaxID=94136 RepID=UPI0029356C17|nr:hypothetical protein [Alkalibacillus haloalkaliphilus]MDV2582584.1 hypothetical protein [Alkalibacillus haloalkaliphilus]
MKKVLILILLVVILGACSQQENDTSGERHEGIIIDIEKNTFDEIKYIVLSLPSVEDIDISNKTREELIGLAQENDGVFYHLNQEEYEEIDLEIGKRIVGYYSAVGESNPPVLFTDKIEVFSQ